MYVCAIRSVKLKLYHDFVMNTQISFQSKAIGGSDKMKTKQFNDTKKQIQKKKRDCHWGLKEKWVKWTWKTTIKK